MRHIMTAATLAALGGSTAFAQDVATITIWGTEPEPMATAVLAEEFDALRDDIEIEFRNIAFSDINQEYMRGIATGSGPDIFMVNTTDTHFYAASGVLLDLTDLVAASEIIDYDEIFPGYQAAITYEDRVYQVPRGANTIMLFYNTAMIEAAGIDPAAAPESWAQLDDYVARLTDPEARVFGIAFSAKNNQEGPWQWLPFARMAGADWDDVSADGAVRALTLWRDWVANGQASQEVLVWSQADGADSFRAGLSALVIQGSWDVGAMAEAPFDWGLWMLPPEEAGGPRVSAAGDFTYAISAQSAHPEQAFEVIEYIYSQDGRIWNEFSRLPARAVAPENPVHPEAYAAFLEQLQFGRVLGPYDKWNDVSLALQDAIQATLAGQSEPAAALDAAAARIAALTAE